MATVGGRPILDAMIMLLCANQWFGVSDENALPSLLRRSREYQGTVTEDLAEQVFSGLETLLKGFQTAAERDKSGLLREALERDEDHLYRGLLTVMLRLVFILYAEDRGLLPVDHPLYAQRMSLLGLFERLQRDHGNFPDSMNNRFGAWGHIISLSRAIYLGVEHGDFHIPPRQGDLFDPHRYPFLEGWSGGSAPIVTQTARAEVKVPTVDDGTVFALLRSLLIFQGQRLSYRTLDVEQIGSVYEALMGYQVSPCESPAVAIKIKNKKGVAKYWVEPESLLARPVGGREKWLKDECGFDTTVAKKIKKALDDVGKKKVGDQNAAIEALLPLTAGKKGLAHEQRANIGQYVLQPGSERRRSGTQYTPRALTEPIVRRTLEPLLLCLGENPSADQLLELKICDPAMGSGAFLVECCRQLADEVVAAWGRAHEVEEIAANCPEGDVVAHARRLVAQRCLYGVDKNAMAVQLAKLSLWLFTLARDLPFTFLDHSFRYGDSLVGLDLEQIKAFHWKPEKQLSFLGMEIRRALDEVVTIRQEIHELAGDATPEGQKLKAQRLFDANDATEKVRRVADTCVGAFFEEPKEKPRLLERQMREELVREWLAGDEKARRAVQDWADEIRLQHAPFHWWLEFPEVFYESRTDPLAPNEAADAACMEAVVGNPPFLGGKRISGELGGSYSSWITQLHAVGKNVDLSAHFFRRAESILGSHGTMGLVATIAIGQGETRDGGLAQLLARGALIYDARSSLAWPGDAAVTVSVVHLSKGLDSFLSPESIQLNGSSVDCINSRLDAAPERGNPKKLVRNADCSYVGSFVNGSGFVLDPAERSALISKDPKNAERIFPYIGGEDLNSTPAQENTRFIIDFGSMTLEEARRWPDLLSIVEERVKPGRDTVKRDAHRKYWWHYGDKRRGLYEKLERLPRCLVNSAVSKALIFAFQPTDRVFSHALNVFTLEQYSSFAVLQSRVHEFWAWLLASTRPSSTGTGIAGLRYSATDCFATFPFPDPDPRAVIKNLEVAGQEFYAARAALMIESDVGLTKIYNALKSPEDDNPKIADLRRLHESMDKAVLGAYGWSDIGVPPYCAQGKDDAARIAAFENEIIDRLFTLNAERGSEEEQLELSKKPTGNRKAKGSASRKSKTKTNATMSLPGMNDAEGAS